MRIATITALGKAYLGPLQFREHDHSERQRITSVYTIMKRQRQWLHGLN